MHSYLYYLLNYHSFKNYKNLNNSINNVALLNSTFHLILSKNTPILHIILSILYILLINHQFHYLKCHISYEISMLNPNYYYIYIYLYIFIYI